MLCVDYLVTNRDRHGSNIEVLRNEKTGSVRLAPLFDQGVSLLFSTYGDEKQIQNLDVMQDFAVNNFIRSRSLRYNLSLIPQDYDLHIRKITEKDREYIMDGISEILSKNYEEKIWEMIWKGKCHFICFCMRKRNEIL